MKLEGKSIILIGGTTGMGEASARLFAAEGAHVTIAGRSNADDTLNAIKTAGGSATFVRTDISNPAEIGALFAQHIKDQGRLDVVFNNAAYEGSFAMIEDTTLEDFDRIVNTNYRAVFVACQIASPIMKKAGKGSIINTTAASSREGYAWPRLGAYIGSKAAVVGFTRSLAIELAGTGVRANCLSPGLIETPMLRGFTDQDESGATLRGLQAAPLLKRLGRPDEIATAALFLAGDDSSYITGVDLLVDGGLILGGAPG